MPYATNKDADQPAHPRSLISTFVVRCLDLEVITWPPSHYQAYRPGSSILARGPLGPRANMECRADMPGNATVDMF